MPTPTEWRGARAKRPPLVLIILSVVLLALGTTGGGAMSLLTPAIRQYATERIFEARELHYLSGSRAYDAEVVSEIVFRVEAGLSFFHTHGEGVGIILLFGAIVVASVVPSRRVRGLLYWLLGLSFLFPIGYIAYGAFILLFGRDRGISLAELTLLVPFGAASILGLGGLLGALGFIFFANGHFRRMTRSRQAPRTLTTATPATFRGWWRPPTLLAASAALLIVLAEVGGASMARFKPEISAFVTARAEERAEVHGLVGSNDVDNEALDEIGVKHDSALRLFHLHAEGLGLMLFAGGLVIRTLVGPAWLRAVLYTLVGIGGFSFPFGYLVWAGLMPFVGLEPARRLAASFVLIPAGGALLVGLWLLAALLALMRIAQFRHRPLSVADVPLEAALRMPPLAVVVASLLLLLLAELGGGAMVKLKLELDRLHRGAVETRPQVHGLVGVRQIDGPVVDELLRRSDFAFRLFHLHAAGVALVIFAGGLMVRNFLGAGPLPSILQTMLAAGGFLYPFGYLAWSWLISTVGLEASKTLVEVFLWIPFGGAVLIAVGFLSLALLSRLLVALGHPREHR
ncbi:MAG: hypothetical protein HY727_15435 [Candidatus Rokubacteria bacterium]|nr:hypothetical protein [Candidatus Rokubacteria bacterium]